ncbi:MAG: ABC transporter permease, partial [Candidatus Aminicenantes bacterium]
MFRNYIKTALRNMRKFKGYAFINIAGLAIGIACCILIILWVRDELSFDAFHERADRLYRVVEQQYYAGGELFPVAVTPAPLAPALKDEIPEVVNSVRITRSPRLLIRYEERTFYENDIILADPSVFGMFSFQLVKGDPDTALNKINSIILSESMATKYFGDQDPLNKVLKIGNMYDLTVTGVMEDIPRNSHLQFNCIIPFEIMKMAGDPLDRWGNNSYFTYVELAQSAEFDSTQDKITGFLKKHHPQTRTTLHLQPLERIHLYSDFTADVSGHGDIKYVYIFSLVALFVLLIACINFMNLTTARSGNRAKEVGMRKVTGAQKRDIVKQFLGESMLFAFIAFLFALGIVLLLLPAFNNLSGKHLSLFTGESLDLLAALIGVALLTGLLSGSYPVLYLSSFQPVTVLKGAVKSGPKSSTFRRVLVIVQFSLSIFLIIATSIIHSQLEYIRNKKLGYEKEHVIYMRIGMNAVRYYEPFKLEALTNPDILGIGWSSQLPAYIVNSTSSVNWPGKDPDESILMHNTAVDYDFIETMKMEIVEGRNFSREFTTDEKNAFILNEEAARLLGGDSAVGKPFTLWEIEGSVIGVVKNFHFKSLNTRVEPLVIRLLKPQPYSYMFVSIRGEDVSQSVKYLEKTWRDIATVFPFEYQFLDEYYDRTYRAEQRMGKLFNAFTALAIFIACLGLLGLASFMAEQRTKEIGIRKVLGASVSNIILLLSREYVLLVAISNLLAWPLAYYFMNKWLENYAYHASINAFIFLASALAALGVALLTVSYQAFKAASSDP